MDISGAGLLFHLLDNNNDGKLSYEEFVNGVLRLRGPAKSIELSMLVKDYGFSNEMLIKKTTAVESKIVSVMGMLKRIEKIQERAIVDDSVVDLDVTSVAEAPYDVAEGEFEDFDGDDGRMSLDGRNSAKMVD